MSWESDETACPRCEQSWVCHPRTTNGGPAEYPTDCPPTLPAVERVKRSLAQLRELTDEHGSHKGAVMFQTGLSADDVDRLGGIEG